MSGNPAPEKVAALARARYVVENDGWDHPTFDEKGAWFRETRTNTAAAELRALNAAGYDVVPAAEVEGLRRELAAWQHAARIGARAAGVPRERVEPCGHCGHMHWFGVNEAEDSHAAIRATLLSGSCGACRCEMWTKP